MLKTHLKSEDKIDYLYDACLNDECEGVTQHKSGFCEKCRTYECVRCGYVFISSKDIRRAKKVCADCKRLKSL